MKAPFSPSEGPSNLEASFLKAESAEMRGQGLSRSFLEGRESDRRGGIEDAFLRETDGRRGQFDVESFERSWHDRRQEIPEDRNVHGRDINDAFKTLNSRTDDLADYAYAADSTLAKHIDRIAPKMVDARALGDAAKVDRLSSDLFRGASGRYGEFVVEKLFSPYFERVTPQYRSVDGKTVMDVFCEGVRLPMYLGRNAFVPQGGTLAIEVKVARPGYFRSELESGHLIHQVGGHRLADAGIVIATKDMKVAYSGASKEFRDGARDTLKEAGSPLFCFLPPKEEIDRAMMNLLERRMKHLAVS